MGNNRLLNLTSINIADEHQNHAIFRAGQSFADHIPRFGRFHGVAGGGGRNSQQIPWRYYPILRGDFDLNTSGQGQRPGIRIVCKPIGPAGERRTAVSNDSQSGLAIGLGG